jgi:hypothetical protein
MAITYTIGWSHSRDDSLDDREFGSTAVIIGDSSTVLTPANIFTAVHASTSAAFPAINSRSAYDNEYYLHRRSAPVFKGPRFAEVQLVYRRGRGSGREETDDPLAAPVRYRWRFGTTSEATDADVNGNPLLNSAGDPFADTIQTDIGSLFVDAIRNEAAFDPQYALSYLNKINSDAFQIAGQGIQPGQALCKGITPAEYTLQSNYVEVTYSMELRGYFPGTKFTQFIHRLMDKGRRGWIYQDQLVDIGLRGDSGDNADTIPVGDDVPLVNGIPMEDDKYVGVAANFDPDDGRGWADQGVRRAPDATRHVNQKTGVNFLLYGKHDTVPFGGLGL